MKNKLIYIFILIIIFSCFGKSDDKDISKEYKELKVLAEKYKNETIKYFKAGDLNNSKTNALLYIETIKKNADNDVIVNKKRGIKSSKEEYFKTYLSGGDVFLCLGLIYFEEGNYEKAYEELKKGNPHIILTDPPELVGYYFALLSLIKLNKVLNEKEFLDNKISKYIDTQLKMPIFYYDYARVLYENKNYKKALEKINKGIEIYKYNEIPEDFYKNYFEKYYLNKIKDKSEKDYILNYYKYNENEDKYYINLTEINEETKSKIIGIFLKYKLREFKFADDVKTNLRNIKLNVTLKELEDLRDKIKEKL